MPVCFVRVNKKNITKEPRSALLGTRVLSNCINKDTYARKSLLRSHGVKIFKAVWKKWTTFEENFSA
jgi:hypothetical protein